MSKMGGYAIQQQEQHSKLGRRAKQSEANNVPTAFRDQRIDAKIAECISQGLDEAEASILLIKWNATQASPMKIGLVKQRVYFAYRDLELPTIR